MVNVPIKFFKEAEIIRLVEESKAYTRPKIFNFQAIWDSSQNGWFIHFSNKDYEVCKIGLKADSKKERIFKKINGVEAFFRKVGVNEFKVIL